MKELVLDDFRIESLAARPEVTSLFPFFLVRVTSDPACCGGFRRNHVDYAHVKRALLNLSEASRQKLKELVGAGSVTFYPPAGPDGVVRPVRF